MEEFLYYFLIFMIFQLTPEAQSALLQQVLSLTPEQLSSLPIEEQQQVLQLQKALSSSSR